MEHIISGYCRAQDQSRTVFLEYENGAWDCTCGFPDCVHAGSCQLAKQMRQIQEEAEQ